MTEIVDKQTQIEAEMLIPPCPKLSNVYKVCSFRISGGEQCVAYAMRKRIVLLKYPSGSLLKNKNFYVDFIPGSLNHFWLGQEFGDCLFFHDGKTLYLWMNVLKNGELMTIMKNRVDVLGGNGCDIVAKISNREIAYIGKLKNAYRTYTLEVINLQETKFETTNTSKSYIISDPLCERRPVCMYFWKKRESTVLIGTSKYDGSSRIYQICVENGKPSVMNFWGEEYDHPGRILQVSTWKYKNKEYVVSLAEELTEKKRYEQASFFYIWDPQSPNIPFEKVNVGVGTKMCSRFLTTSNHFIFGEVTGYIKLFHFGSGKPTYFIAHRKKITDMCWVYFSSHKEFFVTASEDGRVVYSGCHCDPENLADVDDHDRVEFLWEEYVDEFSIQLLYCRVNVFSKAMLLM